MLDYCSEGLSQNMVAMHAQLSTLDYTAQMIVSKYSEKKKKFHVP